LLWGGLTLLLLWGGLTLLLLWCGLALLLLWCGLALLLLRGGLALLLLWGGLVLLLLLLLNSLVLPLLASLTLLLLLLPLLNSLTLLLLLGCLALLRLGSLALLLLDSLIARLERRRDSHIAICGERLVDGQIGRTPMIDVGKLSPVGAGNMLILELSPHGRSMLFMPRRQFRRPGAHLHAALPAVEAHAVAATMVIVHAAIINVMHD
jgi:hypothetical protein